MNQDKTRTAICPLKYIIYHKKAFTAQQKQNRMITSAVPGLGSWYDDLLPFSFEAHCSPVWAARRESTKPKEEEKKPIIIALVCSVALGDFKVETILLIE